MKVTTIALILIFSTTLSFAQWLLQNPIMSNSGYYCSYFFNDLTGIIGTNPISRTTNGGITWTSQTGSGGISMTFSNVFTGFTGGSGGYLIRTTDGGSTWYPVSSGTNAEIQGIHFPSVTTGYLAGYVTGIPGNGVIVKSTNAGESWNVIYNISSLLYSVWFTNNNTGYVSGSTGKILKTTNGGPSWVQLNTNTTSGLHIIKFINSSTGYAAGGAGTIIKTTDAGSSWISKSVTGYNDIGDLFFINANTGYIQIDYANAGNILKTTNGGDTWSQTRLMLSYQSVTNVFFTSESIGYVGGWPRTKYKTTDSGLNWFYPSDLTNEHMKSVSFADTSLGIAVGNNGTILRTINSGTNWTKINTSITNNLNSIFTVDMQKFYACGSNGLVLYSSNAGLVWNTLSSGVVENLKCIWFNNPNTGFVTGGQGLILRTTNSGENWQQISSQTSNSISSIQFADQSTGFCCGANGYVGKTTNAGLSWVLLNSNTSFNLNSIDFLNGSTGFLAGDNGYISKTVNGGINWVVSTPPTSSRANSICFITQDTGLTIFENGDIAISTNGGNSWTPVYAFSMVKFSLNGLFLNSSKRGCIVGDYGIIQYARNGIGNFPIGISESNELPVSFSLSQNYPNPFNPVTTIRFSIPPLEGVRGRTVSLVIYDILGREITTLVNEKLSPGTYEVTWDATNYLSGVYFYQLTEGDYLETRKMILLK